MAFRMRVESMENLGGETCIRGRLIEGAYFGPQYIRLTDTAGAQRTTAILGHKLIEPQGWPVLAGHDTQLVLSIATPSPPFLIGPDSIVEGLSSVALRRDSIDLSTELSNPLFWGNFCVVYMTTDSSERPDEEFLGLRQDDVNRYYTDFLSPLIDSETWPIFPLELDAKRYAEIEWAGSAEFQERVWIGAREPDRRALLGYNSGHFSLPGLRPSELTWLLDRLEQTKAHPASGLLLVPMCYLPEPGAALTARIAGLCARIPGARAELAPAMAANMIEHQVVPGVKWERRPGVGWCCNWQYSQRNPQCPMSVLTQAEFEFIGEFFSEVQNDG